MFGSTAIEVAIGLICVYMALSLVCSSLKEVIAQFTKLRATGKVPPKATET